MRLVKTLFVFSILLVSCGPENDPILTDSRLNISKEWETAEPSDLGFDLSKLNSALEEAEDITRLRSLLVVKNGKLVSENYYNGDNVNSQHDVRSVTKSVVATLVAIALDRGDIGSLDQKINLGDQYSLSDQQQKITYRHLLTMTAGFEWDEWTNSSYSDWYISSDEIQYLLNLDMVSEPGETFTYNSGAVHLLAYALTREINMSLQQYADKVLFDKAGIEDKTWEIIGTGPNGGAGIDLTARDLARFGQLHLQNGKSGNTKIVSTENVELFTQDYHELDWTYGEISGMSYGYLWWTATSPYNAYFAWGYGGQFIVVVPEFDMVVVTTTDWSRLQLEGGPVPLTQQVLNMVFSKVIASADN